MLSIVLLSVTKLSIVKRVLSIIKLYAIVVNVVAT